MLYILVFVVVGIVAGFIAGLFGVGGGIIMVPIFVYLFNRFGVSHAVIMHVAEGTSLALAIPSAVAASWKQIRLGSLDLRYYQTWWVSVLVGSVVGAIIVPYLNTEVLQGIFTGFLLVVALYLGFVSEETVIARKLPQGWIKGAIASAIGLCSVLIGVGGGIFTTPTLTACNYPLKRSIALATATTFVVGTVGAVGAIIAGWGLPGRPRFALGFVDLLAFVLMLPSAWIFAPFGAKVGHELPKQVLRKIYAAFLLIIAAYMFDVLLSKH